MRLGTERHILERLSGVAGVPRLAQPTPGAHPEDAPAIRHIDGVSLRDALQAQALPLPSSLPTLLDIGLQLARILADVHRLGVSHRNINPSSIVLTGPDRQAMLVGFELATTVAEQQPACGHHRDIAGSLAYLAPEQTGRTGHSVDQRADLYSLGATLYELVTGRAPFENSDPLQLIHNLLAQLPTRPDELVPGTPVALSDIVMRLLEKEPDRRYQSAEGLARDLTLLSQHLAAGATGSFALGGHDFAQRLSAPSRLVGRDAEIAGLKRAFENALNGGARGVLVSGTPGVGKTALINELRPMVAARHGWFVAGKFDSQRQDLASDGVFQALRALGRMLLAGPETELQALRKRIVRTIGRAGCQLMAGVPEIGLLLGEQPVPGDIDPLTAKDRLVEVTLDLLRAVASPARPVVMVVDDLQWASALPIAIVHAVLTDDSLSGLLLVGAYRDGEVDALRPLAPMLPRWARLESPPLSLSLQNLPPADLATLLAEMLRLAPTQAALLAQALRAHTDGNPFDTVQLVDALRRDGALMLGDEGWVWDAKAIARHIGQGNVIDLLTRRVAALAPETRQVLDVMACLGGEVELPLLQAACGASAEALEQRLAPALEDHLLAMQHDGLPAMRFRHDRVQQACLERLAPAERGRLHLTLARRLEALPDFAATAAHQYLPALAAIDAPSECLRVAELLRRTAQPLRAFNPAMAEHLLAGALELLARSGLCGTALLPLQIERHAVLYSLGRLAEVDALYVTIERDCTDALQLAEPACVQICSLTNQGQARAAVALGETLLGRLGLALPTPEQLGVQMNPAHGVFNRWLDPDTEAADLQRPIASDPRALAAGRLLNRMTPPSFFCDPAILAGLVLTGQRLWIEHGPAAPFVGTLSHAAFITIGAWQDYRTGLAIVRRVLAASDARGFHPEASQSRFLFALGSGPWSIPLEGNAAEAERAHEGLVQGGDLNNACYTYYASLYPLMDCATTLERYAAESAAALAFSARTGNDYAAAAYVAHRQLARMLRGETAGLESFDEASFSEAAHLARLGPNPVAEVNFHVARGIGAALAGDGPALIRHAAAAMPLTAALPGIYPCALAQLLHALALAERLKTAAPAEHLALLAELDACVDWLRLRAVDAPFNFSHLVHWIAAERAWACGEPLAALNAFDTALREAAPLQRPWHNALIAERAARCLLANGMQFAGQRMMAVAQQRYAAWGASAKVRQLQRDHAFLGALPAAAAGSAPALRENVSADAIDQLGILRAAQALSSETSLERLRLRVVELLAELSGATTVQLALWDDDAQQWLLPQSGDGTNRTTLADAGARGLLPLSAFRYVERTREPLLLDDATRDDRFAGDPALRGAERCSLLVVPILHHGVTRAMLLLENRLGRGAFTVDRLDAVMLITGQLAVSLANAQLYEQLERRVQERTQELQQAQAQLLSAARLAGMAEIATNVLHNVGNVLNSVNVSAGLVGTRLRTSKVKGVGRAARLMAEHAGDLGPFLTQDARGKLLPGYLGELAQALEAEHIGMAEELAGLSQSVDHIKVIVATQQAYAGTAYMVESVKLNELLNDALRMNAGALTRRKVEVVTDIAELPDLPLDRHRLLQIFVNLISNAKHALNDVTDRSPCIRLVAALADAGTLRISVADNGEGIAPENLTRVFAHGFTTRKDGNGFGLHSCVLAAQEMGGRLSAHSDGPGLGARFTLELPVDTAQGQP
ncbi:ATPase [Hydrogenophaga sp. A37]|nr:ATPase [Hydrogenophaga sp. A37]